MQIFNTIYFLPFLLYIVYEYPFNPLGASPPNALAFNIRSAYVALGRRNKK